VTPTLGGVVEYLYGVVLVAVMAGCYLWYRRRKRSGLALAREFDEVTRTADAPVNPIEKALLAANGVDEHGDGAEVPGGYTLTSAQAQAARDIRAVCERAKPKLVLHHRRGLIFTVTRADEGFVIIRHNYAAYPPSLCRYVCGPRVRDGIFFGNEPSSESRADNAATDGMKPLPPKVYELLLDELQATYRKV
jgi:hypothetical protein